MSADDFAIDVRGCSKAYRVYPRPVERFKQLILGDGEGPREFWALRDVTFRVHPGEVMGIIGRNGSGKSTLLQIIAGTTAPSAGEVAVRGRAAALLELGSGFNIEFTGRENVHLNAALLGLTPRQIAERFDEIVAFAEIGEFLDQPVKTYSSGMVVRLAFAVAAHVDASVLIVDEALAVGDAVFQARCLRRMERLRDAGVTILLATHDTTWVSTVCDRAVLLDGGALVIEGPGKAVVEEYYRRVQRIERLGGGDAAGDLALAEPREARPERPSDAAGPDPCDVTPVLDPIVPGRGTRMGDRSAEIVGLAICDGDGRKVVALRARQTARMYLAVRVHADLQEPHIGVCLRDVHGRILVGAHTLYEGLGLGRRPAGQEILIQFEFPVQVNPGRYLLMLGVADHESHQVWRDCDTIFDYQEIEVMGDERAWGEVNVPARATLVRDARAGLVRTT